MTWTNSQFFLKKNFIFKALYYDGNFFRYNLLDKKT